MTTYRCWKETSCLPLLNTKFGPWESETPSRQQTECLLTYIYTYITRTYVRSYICTYIFVVVNFDALAQARDIQIERRQVVFHCWMQDLNPGSQTPNRQQTECSLTNRLSYRGSSYKTWTGQPVPMISEHSAHLTPLSVDFRTWLWRYTHLLLLMGDILQS